MDAILHGSHWYLWRRWVLHQMVLVLKQVVEKHNLLLEFQSYIISPEKLGVLLLQLLPNLINRKSIINLASLLKITRITIEVIVSDSQTIAEYWFAHPLQIFFTPIKCG